jgi:hypothetical protein
MMFFKKSKTINSWDSLVVTHPTTNQPAHSLSTTEQTGRAVFYVLWSIARTLGILAEYEDKISPALSYVWEYQPGSIVNTYLTGCEMHDFVGEIPAPSR